MLFSSMSFLILFLPVTLAGYFLLPKVFRNLWLLAASLVFYAWGGTGVCEDYGNVHCHELRIWSGSGQGPRKHQLGCRLCLVIMAVCNLALLGYFKYMNFFVETVNQAAGRQIFASVDIALPIGISFFTFQAMSYVIDVYRQHGNGAEKYFKCGALHCIFSSAHCRSHCQV